MHHYSTLKSFAAATFDPFINKVVVLLFYYITLKKTRASVPVPSVAEPEPMEPKLFETLSRKYIFDKKLLRSVLRMMV